MFQETFVWDIDSKEHTKKIGSSRSLVDLTRTLQMEPKASQAEDRIRAVSHCHSEQGKGKT